MIATRPAKVPISHNIAGQLDQRATHLVSDAISTLLYSHRDNWVVDVTGLDVSPGDEVVLLGRQGDERIDAREVAATIGTIPWELLCRLGARIQREYC